MRRVSLRPVKQENRRDDCSQERERRTCNADSFVIFCSLTGVNINLVKQNKQEDQTEITITFEQPWPPWPKARQIEQTKDLFCAPEEMFHPEIKMPATTQSYSLP